MIIIYGFIKRGLIGSLLNFLPICISEHVFVSNSYIIDNYTGNIFSFDN